MKITVLYTCLTCGTMDAPVQVRQRGPEEDVRDWMNTVIFAVAYDHEKRSPLCTATKMTNLKIPITGAPRIGDPAIN